MLDIKQIRENPEELDSSLAKRNHPSISDKIISADNKNRAIIVKLQALQEERNSKSKLIGTYTSEGKKDEAEKLKSE